MEEGKKRVRIDTRVRMNRNEYDKVMGNLARLISEEADYKKMSKEMNELLRRYQSLREKYEEMASKSNCQTSYIRLLEEENNRLKIQLEEAKSCKSFWKRLFS